MKALRDISGGAVTAGTAVLACKSEIFGGAIISADGTNAVTLTVRKNDGAGAIVFQMTTKSTLPIFAPFEADAVVHYTLSGTGGSAQMFEWYDG
jgi:hypothetical protein